VVLCRLGGSRAWKTLVFSRPSWIDVWCGCLSVWSYSGWASFSACVLSPYISSDILLSGTIIRGTLKAPNSQLVTPISIKPQRPDGCD
jgi:hypothetical protein